MSVTFKGDFNSALEKATLDQLNAKCKRVEKYFFDKYHKKINITLKGTSLNNSSFEITGDIDNVEDVTKIVLEQIKKM